MELNIIMKYKKIPIPSIHMVKITYKFTKTWNNCITKTKKMINTHHKNTLIKHLMMLSLQNKVIHFTLRNILSFDEIMIE